MKAVFFDIDNTLYSYDQGNEAGMKALTSYAENNLQVARKPLCRHSGRHEKL